MPDDLDPSNDDEPQDADNAVIRELRQKAGRTEAAEAAAETARRELTLHKAGLGSLSDKQMKALTAAHDGDWEPDLLKATATELGFVQQEQTEQAPQVPADELAAMQRVNEASNGQPPAPLSDLDAKLNAATTQEEVIELARAGGFLATD